MLTSETVVTPVEITREQLLEFHTERYINSLSVSVIYILHILCISQNNAMMNDYYLHCTIEIILQRI